MTDDSGTGHAAGKDEIVLLDPFVVSAAEDRKTYEATATIAATRIRTGLKDVGSAISVVTSQFLKDTNSRNSQDLLVYTPNTEVGGLRGNFSGLGNGTRPSEQNALLAPQNNTRVRGLTAADNTRDFFLTDIAWDGFNTGRIEIQRGPNAILFGLGSPAGIINASINSAAFKNEGALAFSTGSHGSHRATLDLNQVLLPQELALRLDLLDDSANFRQKPAFNHDRRIFGSLRWDPKFLRADSSCTSLRVNYEHGRIDANRPHVLPLGDRITPWFSALNKAGFDLGASMYNAPVANLPIAPLMAIFGNPASAENRLTQGFVFGGASPVGVLNPVDYLPKSSSPAEAFKVYRPSLLQDPAVFDYVHQMPEGPNKREWSRHHVFNATLAQTFIDGRLGLEAAYDRQRLTSAALGGADGSALWVDINTQMLDGSPNPNFGRAFILTGGTNGNAYHSMRDSKRLTGFGELRFKDVIGDSPLVRVLGRHVFTGLWEHSHADSESYGWAGQASDVALGQFGEYGQYLGTLNYLGASLADRSSASGAHLPGLAVLQPVRSGEMYFYNGSSWGNQPVSVLNNSTGVREQATFTQLRRDDVESQAIVWQGFLFDDLLVPMIGLRHDRDLAYSLRPNPAAGFTDFASPAYRLPDTPSNVVSGNSTSWSVVAHLPRFIRKKLPGETEFSLFYNRSENFQPNAGRIDPAGTALPPPLGHTKDYGFRLTTFHGRVSLKVNWYDTVVANDKLPEFNSFFQMFATELWGYQFARQTLDNNGEGSFYLSGGYQPMAGQTAAQAKADGFAIATAYLASANQPSDTFYTLYGADRSQWASWSPLTPIDPSSLGVTITGDTRSTGTEYELTAQPVANWNISVNASRIDAQSHNLAKSVAEWIEQRWAVFNTPVPGTSQLAVVGDLRMWGAGPYNPTVRQSYHDTVWIPYLIYRAKENAGVSELRPWRFNFITDYTFVQGRLKGLRIGGACRWQDKVVVGYPVLPTAGSTPTAPVYDLAHPYLGPTGTNVDLWIGYERKFAKKYTWRIQLNVTDLFAKKELIPVTVQPDGSLAAGRIPPPRMWTLTNSVSF